MFTGRFSDKQIEFINNRNHRYCLRGGATRCGKTYLDHVYTIAERIREMRGKDGEVFMIGVTRQTLERNIFRPMREIYGDSLVGRVKKSDGTITLFGQKAYCFSAEKCDAIKKIRGSGVKYVYGDEVADWSKEVFDILHSRLDKPYSRFDGTYNPQGKGHWLYKFLTKGGIDLFDQRYSIFDNPFNDPTVVKDLCAEYSGTVDYNRYILGQWCNAEGAVYEIYANNPDKYDIGTLPQIQTLSMGVDFGGNKSATTFVVSGFTPHFHSLVILKNKRIANKIISPSELETAFVEFVKEVLREYNKPFPVYCDSAEQTLIKGLKLAAAKAGLPVQIKNAIKGEIVERIRLFNRLIGADRFLVYKGNEQVKNAFIAAMYNDKKQYDERLDDGTTDIDTLDATEYSVEPYVKYLFLE